MLPHTALTYSYRNVQSAVMLPHTALTYSYRNVQSAAIHVATVHSASTHVPTA